MPVYEFSCQRCGREFSVSMTISEYGRAKVTCPECGSEEVKRRISTFQAITSKKSSRW